MATRTIKFLGRAYSATGKANITFNFNNQEVFSGEIDARTEETADNSLMDLFTFDIEQALEGDIACSCEVISGDVYIVAMSGNYRVTGSTEVTEEESAADYTWLTDENYSAKNGMRIDGIEYTGDANRGDDLGEWHVLVSAGSTATYTTTTVATVDIAARA